MRTPPPYSQELYCVRGGIIGFIHEIVRRLDASANIRSHKKPFLRISHQNEILTILQLDKMLLSRFPTELINQEIIESIVAFDKHNRLPPGSFYETIESRMRLCLLFTLPKRGKPMINGQMYAFPQI